MKLFKHSLFAILIMLSLSHYAIAENRPAEEVEILSQLMESIAQNDYESFIANGNSRFKRELTKQAFESVVSQIGNLIQTGYKAEYLTELNQQGNKILLWKISYEKSSENALAKLTLIKNKVAGFWLQ